MLIVAVVFHLIPKNIINISYLYPFFLFGYYSKNIACVGWKRGFGALALFALLFVFIWRPEYKIWRSGGYVLHNTVFMIRVVLIRFMIGVLGIYAATFILGKFYDLYKNKFITNWFVGIGKETLSLYLLQHIVVEIGLMRFVHYMNINHLLTGHQVLFGYIVAPVVSLLLLVAMYNIVSVMQKHEITRWMFGFRINLDWK